MPDSAAPQKDRVLRALSATNGARGAVPAPDAIELAPLSGGSARRSYVASAEHRAWVVRTPADGSSGALDIAGECAVTRAAGERGVTPKVVACDPGAGLLITEYRRHARILTPEAARGSKNLRRIVQLLRQLHGLRLPLRRFDPHAFAGYYVEVLGGRSALAPKDRRLADALTALADDHRARHRQESVCHNDLVASNILDDGERLWLIDFEYAVTAAPVLDLASLAAMNDYGPEERRELTETYHAGSTVPFGQEELGNAVRLVRLVSYFWALARIREVDDPEPFARYAEELAAALS